MREEKEVASETTLRLSGNEGMGGARQINWR
jgi:hypothetical protein